ncbi:MAG TPA: hypothetical protein VGP88_01035 [Thermoplasmata archaeon]|jgi:hypothetical protein|nr:hypothetical protein [Thermoplasmata archaeon]
MTVRRLSIGMFVLLAIEFALGLVLALFVNLPMAASVVSVLTSTPVLDLHILVALAIIGISLRAVALARAEPGRTALVASLLVLGSALVATASGWAFAFDGQDPAASLVMTLGFVGALVGAIVLLVRPSRPAPAPASAS